MARGIINIVFSVMVFVFSSVSFSEAMCVNYAGGTICEDNSFTGGATATAYIDASDADIFERARREEARIERIRSENRMGFNPPQTVEKVRKERGFIITTNQAYINY